MLIMNTPDKLYKRPADIEQFKFKSKNTSNNQSIDNRDDYDLDWEPQWQSSGCKLLHDLMKKCLFDSYSKKYSDYVPCLKSMLNDINKNNWYWRSSVNIDDDKGLRLHEKYLPVNYRSDRKIYVYRCLSSMDKVFDYLIDKWGDYLMDSDNLPDIDLEDFLLLKGLMPLAYMKKNYFQSIEDFMFKCDKCWSYEFCIDDIMYNIEDIKLSNDESMILYLQAPKFMSSNFGYNYEPTDLWKHFRDLNSQNYMHMMRDILSNTIKQSSFLRMLLHESNNYSKEICRIINFMNNSQMSQLKTTQYLLDSLNIKY